MRKALVGILAGVAVGAAVDAQAAPVVDKENGTITRSVKTADTPDGNYREVMETTSCRRGWIAVQRSQKEGGPALIDLTVGHGNGKNNVGENISAIKRAETVRTECRAAGLEPGF